MQLIGYYESPFARRVGVTLMLYGIPFEHRAVATSDRVVGERNPIGRIPALVLDDGETLIDSTMIIDHLDSLVPPERALTPRDGKQRRAVNRIVAVALGTCEKYVAAYYEISKRPESHVWGPWLDRIEAQVASGMQWLEQQLGGPHMVGDKITQADVTTIVAVDAVRFDMAHLAPDGKFPKLEALVKSVADMPAFRETRPDQPAAV
jgi:glutathione S-transferase